jgi:hypothetical protein
MKNISTYIDGGIALMFIFDHNFKDVDLDSIVG